jgi:hypothetical protein
MAMTRFDHNMEQASLQDVVTDRTPAAAAIHAWGVCQLPRSTLGHMVWFPSPQVKINIKIN